MSRAVLISIRPKWCELIASGEKTIEVRKTRPKLDPPFRCYIYMTSGGASIPNGKGMVHHHSGGRCVIGEFVCDDIRDFRVREDGYVHDWHYADLEYSCLDVDDIVEYIGRNRKGYTWGISDLVIYDRPRELIEFRFSNSVKGRWNKDVKRDMIVKKPPQSWCYVEEMEGTDG